MKYEQWEPYYRAILEDFGWTAEGDEAAARLLSSLLPEDTPCLEKVKELIQDQRRHRLRQSAVAGEGHGKDRLVV